MKKSLVVVLVVVAVIVLLIAAFAGTFISKYNTLVQLDEEVQMASSQIDNQLQRRNDLIPNLVETVKGYANQEKEIFANVSDARAKLIGATGVQDKAAADSELSSSLSRLLAISENYPDLKSNENFIQLSDELAGTENRIAVARQDYNTVANQFNKTVKQFPMNIFAGFFGFDKAEYFQAAEGAEQVPTVDFNN